MNIKNFIQPEETLFLNGSDDEIVVRYEYDRGEAQWFDARAGVGSPGYPAECYITEIKVNGEFVDAVDTEYSEAQLLELEDKLMDKIVEREAAENEERAAAEYRAWREMNACD